MQEILASDDYAAAAGAVSELLSKLRLEHAFVGSLALSAFLGTEVRTGSVDVLAMTTPERAGQLPMMAANRGFRVEREKVEATEELDLVPLDFLLPDREVRVHVLMASNALYAKMIGASVEASLRAGVVRVVHPEDLALLLTMAEDEATREKLVRAAGPAFDRERFNRKLVSIGLSRRILV